MTHSRNKGSHAERELCDKLNSMGMMCRRTVQYCGKGGDADITCLDLGLHVEVKRVEAFKWDETMAQVQRDSRGKPWIIAHRKSRMPWVIIQTLDAWAADSHAAHRAIAARRKLIEEAADAHPSV